MTSRRDQDEGQDTAPNSAETHVLNKRKRNGPPPRNRRESNATEVESQQPQSRTQVLEQTTIASGEDDGEHPPDLTTASQDERTSAFTPRSGGRSEEILGGDQCCNDNAGNQSTNSGRVPTASAEFPDVVQPDVVEKLVEVFHHTAYPLRPYFHWPTYRAQVRTRQYRTDWGLLDFYHGSVYHGIWASM
ncbi:hypothetical protein PFICI_12197 [Pestalotiopsis fici W106-1]|uniref:Uncharacterized protein n=1 Tax=Pestalotiopsis fici (strain W106-1 / CGMCC3.15140) TaxID=1229662 RepID=W3WSH6_PESFW|nr:uncharacterized protein PFICI_12197 [Pestalotiopsis fici W106-1]ETS76810.1 hypothetical protein PFICI_12197 [Pestalotiopsis fici W106-1]